MLTKSLSQLKRLRSELRICFRENQSKEKEPFLKIALSGKFSCNVHRSKNFTQLESACEFHSQKQP